MQLFLSLGVSVCERVRVLRNEMLSVLDTQLNRKSEPELQWFIRLSIVLSRCETTAYKIQTICIVHIATISFIHVIWVCVSLCFFIYSFTSTWYFFFPLFFGSGTQIYFIFAMIQWLNTANAFTSDIEDDDKWKHSMVLSIGFAVCKWNYENC